MAGRLLGGLFVPLRPDSLSTHDERLALSKGAAAGSLPVLCGAADSEEVLRRGTFPHQLTLIPGIHSTNTWHCRASVQCKPGLSYPPLPTTGEGEPNQGRPAVSLGKL